MQHKVPRHILSQSAVAYWNNRHAAALGGIKLRSQTLGTDAVFCDVWPRESNID
jgi:hypothetical protein